MKRLILLVLFSCFHLAVFAESANNPSVRLDFQTIPVKDILQILAKINHTNIVVSDNVKGNITVHLENIPWQQALHVILQEQGLGVQKTDNVLLVAPLNELAEHQEMQQTLEE